MVSAKPELGRGCRSLEEALTLVPHVSGVGGRDNRQLSGAFQAVPLPWKAPEPHPQTEHPDSTMCSGGCSNWGWEVAGPRLSPAPPLSTSQSCACCVKGDKPLSQDAMGAAEMLHSLHAVLQIQRCHCLAQQFTTSSLPSTAHFAPVECCFKYAQKRIRHPQSYYETSKHCPNPAVV